MSLCTVSFFLQSQTLHWAAGLGGPLGEHGYAMDVFPDGSVITAGTFHGTIDLDPGPEVLNFSSIGGRDMYLCRLNVDGSLDWVKTFGSTTDDHFRGVIIDSSGDIIVAGYYTGTVDMNPGGSPELLTSAGMTDALLAKFQADGTLVWAQSFGGTNSDYFVAVDVDPFDNIAATGQFAGISQFDASGQAAALNSGGNPEILTAKYNPDGEYQWAFAFPGNTVSAGWAVDSDSQGNIYTAGSFTGNIDVSGNSAAVNISSVGNNDGFLVKWSPDGDLLWHALLSGAQNNYFWGIAIGSDGRVCLVGEVSDGSTLITPGDSYPLVGGGGLDGCAFVLNELGELIFAKTFGSAGNDGLYDAEFQEDFDVALTGLFVGDIEIFGQQVQSNGSLDAITAVLNETGDVQWLATVGGPGVDFGLSVKINEQDEVFFCGNFNGQADLNPLYGQSFLSSAGGVDAYVCKLGPCLTFEGDLGILTRVGDVPFVGLQVVLYPVGQAALEPALSSISASDGLATFAEVPSGEYLCKAVPDYLLAEQADLLGTYTNETYAWPLANILTVGCQTWLADTIDVIQLPFSGLYPGSASGNVFYRSLGLAFEPEPRMFMVGDPIPGVPVIIRLDTIPFQMNFTSASGSYGFVNLPEGAYDLVVDIPGVPMVETHAFSVGAPEFIFENLNFYVDEESGIYITDLVGISDDSTTGPDIKLFPNPASGMVNIQFPESLGQVVIRFSTADGRLLRQHTVSAGIEGFSTDLSDLPQGVYFVEVLSVVQSRVARLVVK